jgi:hypothetical protein
MVKNCVSQVDLVYVAAFFQLHRFMLNGRMSVSGDLQEVVMAYFKAVSRQLPGVIEESLYDL